MEAATDFETVLSKSKKLPTLPGIAIKILEAVQKERPDLQEIAEVLSTDPPLSGEVQTDQLALFRIDPQGHLGIPCGQHAGYERGQKHGAELRPRKELFQ